MKTLSTEVGLGRQDLNYKEIIEHKGHKLRVSIKSDSYDFQSSAKVEVFDNMKWNHVDGIHFSQMKTPATLYVIPKGEKDLSKFAHFFKADRDRLVKLAKDVLGG